MPPQSDNWVAPVGSNGISICHLWSGPCMFHVAERTEFTGQTAVPYLLWGKGSRPDIFLHILWSSFTTAIGIHNIIWFKQFVLAKGSAAKLYGVEEKQDNVEIMLEWGMDLDVLILQQSDVLDPCKNFTTNSNSVTSNITTSLKTLSFDKNMDLIINFDV